MSKIISFSSKYSFNLYSYLIPYELDIDIQSTLQIDEPIMGNKPGIFKSTGPPSCIPSVINTVITMSACALYACFLNQNARKHLKFPD